MDRRILPQGDTHTHKIGDEDTMKNKKLLSMKSFEIDGIKHTFKIYSVGSGKVPSHINLYFSDLIDVCGDVLIEVSNEDCLSEQKNNDFPPNIILIIAFFLFLLKLLQ